MILEKSASTEESSHSVCRPTEKRKKLLFKAAARISTGGVTHRTVIGSHATATQATANNHRPSHPSPNQRRVAPSTLSSSSRSVLVGGESLIQPQLDYQKSLVRRMIDYSRSVEARARKRDSNLKSVDLFLLPVAGVDLDVNRELEQAACSLLVSLKSLPNLRSLTIANPFEFLQGEPDDRNDAGDAKKIASSPEEKRRHDESNCGSYMLTPKIASALADFLSARPRVLRKLSFIHCPLGRPYWMQPTNPHTRLLKALSSLSSSPLTALSLVDCMPEPDRAVDQALSKFLRNNTNLQELTLVNYATRSSGILLSGLAQNKTLSALHVRRSVRSPRNEKSRPVAIFQQDDDDGSDYDGYNTVSDNTTINTSQDSESKKTNVRRPNNLFAVAAKLFARRQLVEFQCHGYRLSQSDCNILSQSLSLSVNTHHGGRPARCRLNRLVLRDCRISPRKAASLLSALSPAAGRGRVQLPTSRPADDRRTKHRSEAADNDDDGQHLAVTVETKDPLGHVDIHATMMTN